MDYGRETRKGERQAIFSPTEEAPELMRGDGVVDGGPVEVLEQRMRGVGEKAVEMMSTTEVLRGGAGEDVVVEGFDMPPTVIERERARERARKAVLETIRTKEMLHKEGVKKVDEVISDLGKTGDVADFYETAREMMEQNLENSYGRKMGDGLTGGRTV